MHAQIIGTLYQANVKQGSWMGGKNYLEIILYSQTRTEYQGNERLKEHFVPIDFYTMPAIPVAQLEGMRGKLVMVDMVVKGDRSKADPDKYYAKLVGRNITPAYREGMDAGREPSTPPAVAAHPAPGPAVDEDDDIPF